MFPKVKVYCITTNRSDMPCEEQVEFACKGGADAIQFGDAKRTAKEIVATGQKLRDICRKYKALFLIGGRPDIALACDADGVHLAGDDIPAEFARHILGPRRTIGIAVSSLGQALAAAQSGADFLSVGPLFPASAEGAVGLGGISLIKKRVKVPVLGAGGITLENVADVVKADADGAIVSRAVCGARDIEQAARELKKKIVDIEEEQRSLIKE